MKKIFFLSLLFIISSCSIKSRQDQKNIRNIFSKGEYDKSLELLNESDLKKKEINKLLFLMEKGRILYRKADYFEASKVFIEANELVDKLYTKSIKEEIISSIGNDNSKTYYGSIFERSMLYYYQAMSYYKLYETGQYEISKKVEVKDSKEKKIIKEVVELSKQQRRKYLFSARASLLAWDSFFKEINRSSRVNTLYRQDLMAKILAGNIHEVIGKRSELNISLQLYKDALLILEKQGLVYHSFNANFKEYTREVKEVVNGKGKINKTKAIKESKHYTQTKDFLHFKILSLTKKIRPSKYSSLLKKYNPSKEVRGKLKNNPNISIVLEQGLISPVEPDNFSFTLKSAIDNIENPTTKSIVNGIGVPILTYFAMGPLGLGAVSTSGNTRIYTSHNIGNYVTKEAGIEFEMPMVHEVAPIKTYSLQVLDKKSNKEVYKKPLNLIGPLSDIALLAANERAENSYKKVGVKVAIKHLVAILAAYKTYQSIKETSGELFAKPAAFTQYMLSAKGIKETEKADTRHWTTLPSNILIDEFSLPNGEYTLNLTSKNEVGVDEVAKALGTLEVKTQEKTIFSYSLN